MIYKLVLLLCIWITIVLVPFAAEAQDADQVFRTFEDKKGR